MLAELDTTESAALADLEAAGDAAALEAWRIEWLGSKGRLKSLMGRMKDVDPGDRPAFGQRMNAMKKLLEAAFAERKAAGDAAPSGPAIDVTEPGIPMGLGQRHIISRTIAEILEVFARMGFESATGPEVEDEWHNFTALNVPESHPAREPIDNFYLDGGGMLRSQTSTVQIRVLETTPPPVRIVAAGRVYRPDTHDATHFSMFHQVEGLWVDRGVTMVDLKSALLGFAHAYFGEEAEVRMRPSFFPFTEPSAEVDMKMRIKGQWQWVELGGCGLVDPNVLTAVGLDPEEWSGFAFGLGVERIAMRKYGIADIRWLFENDARFLRQF
ncbi:MAG: phenylalanine--tRNA ligase subunit alpha [Planctomycetes bacterium]|nr:phenylalanine--tRNA ligase subunit alpha [Planctomycetota bacterium]MCP4837800.1 phenylalanine--tRNA ligase subunit alpha [Planctomycetota bacterium]